MDAICLWLNFGLEMVSVCNLRIKTFKRESHEGYSCGTCGEIPGTPGETRRQFQDKKMEQWWWRLQTGRQGELRNSWLRVFPLGSATLNQLGFCKKGSVSYRPERATKQWGQVLACSSPQSLWPSAPIRELCSDSWITFPGVELEECFKKLLSDLYPSCSFSYGKTWM